MRGFFCAHSSIKNRLRNAYIKTKARCLTFSKSGIKRLVFQKNMESKSQPKESRECGKGEVIRKGADIQKYVDNYDRIFRRNKAKKSSK